MSAVSVFWDKTLMAYWAGNASVRSVQEAELHLAGILQVQDEFEMSDWRLAVSSEQGFSGYLWQTGLFHRDRCRVR